MAVGVLPRDGILLVIRTARKGRQKNSRDSGSTGDKVKAREHEEETVSMRGTTSQRWGGCNSVEGGRGDPVRGTNGDLEHFRAQRRVMLPGSPGETH